MFMQTHNRIGEEKKQQKFTYHQLNDLKAINRHLDLARILLLFGMDIVSSEVSQKSLQAVQWGGGIQKLLNCKIIFALQSK